MKIKTTLFTFLLCMFSFTPIWAMLPPKYVKKETILLSNDGIHALTKEGDYVGPCTIYVNSNGYYVHPHGGACGGTPIYQARIYVDKDKIQFADDAIHVDFKGDHVRAHCLSHDRKRGYYVEIFPTGQILK